jgi:hypothetical protein
MAPPSQELEPPINPGRFRRPLLAGLNDIKYFIERDPDDIDAVIQRKPVFGVAVLVQFLLQDLRAFRLKLLNGLCFPIPLEFSNLKIGHFCYVLRHVSLPVS